ncbi:hypothetical protein SNL152K_1192 [Streptomyces sp. NL15-2K]|nr:hypothetical protein SNL152K_1192 [Streptomyces sp. NL15-2K]
MLGRLGDTEWLGAAVAKPSSGTSWYAPNSNRLVTETNAAFSNEERVRCRSLLRLAQGRRTVLDPEPLRGKAG